MASNLLYRLILRTGLSTAIKKFLPGEGAYATDTKTVYVGDDTATPPAIATTKSTGKFDFSSAEEFKLPGGAVFSRAKAGLVDGVPVRKFNEADGILVRTGDGTFAARRIRSSDGSILIDNERGVAGDIDLRLDPDSDAAGAISLRVYVSGMPPENPRGGMTWFDNLEAVFYIYIEEAEEDGGNAYWMSLT